MLKSFFNYLAHEKRCSEQTIVSYRTDLLQFQDFLKSEFDITTKEANHQMIRSWIVSMVESGIRPVSINRKMATLRSYYKFLIKTGELTKNPTHNLKPIRTEQKLPQFVGETDMVKLLDHFPFEDSFFGMRDRLVLELFYSTGIRLSELLGLKDESVDYSRSLIKVLGKRNKERIIPVSASVIDHLKAYLAIRDKTFNLSNQEYLIVTDSGKPAYPVFVYRLVKKHLSFCTTLEKRSPHIMRHTFATHLLNKGADLNAVKDLLGHAGLAATQVYTHNSLDKIKKVFKQAHPKA
jgi:integrase/recombinase XerC